MIFVSYAQNFEDVMLWRALRHIEYGFYIDVGAHDPESGSITKAFYDRQWRGINVEPIAKPFKALELARPRDINLQLCVGARDGEIDLFDVLPSGLATAQPGVAEMHRAAGHEVHKITVPVRRLENICQEYVSGDIHFLKIDVEGLEKDVLLGMDFSAFRPWIVVVEATIPNSPVPCYQEWESILLEAKYEFVYFDGLNRFYIASERPELRPSFDLPPNFFDGFALAATNFFARNLAARIEEAEARAMRAEVRVSEMTNSTSWRLTAPLRWLKERGCRQK